MSKFNKSSSSSSSDVCVTGADDNSTKSHDTGEFDWDESTQGVILGAFFYGYLVLQVLGGRLAEIYGAKWLCAGGIAASIVINALTPLIARSAPYWLLLASRVVLGMFQAFIFPSSFALLTKWIPDHERSTFLAFPTLGANIGSIVTTALSGYLAEHGFAGGWPSVFYVAAMTASVSLLFWVFIVKSEPKDHPWISEHELNYIHSNIAANNTSVDNKDRPKRSVPWLKVFTSTQVLSFLVGMLLYGMYSGGDNAIAAAFTTGVITPLVVGYILEASDQTQRQWGYVFYMSASINILGGLVFAIFGSARRQDWDMDDEHQTEEITITKI
ncbi:unnamed protein product [Medioppia subpectinata]|uniref:Major facilitator superfamily (MFS) profile domain-containing protein n=1 Tax=Medioppia subpectinata TaxID=1979941 RepID=A0A7R9KES0_9ACAR|nr:unnamed protein product [Medioppia subpectinata]CAG2102002.1 unnamed protein product [Medioppia subpectinata]